MILDCWFLYFSLKILLDERNNLINESIWRFLESYIWLT